MISYFADLEQQVTSLGVKTVVYATIILVIATVVAALMKDKAPKLKLPLFLLMAITLVGSTLLLMGSTIYLNTKAESKGPVHWHTEVEFWACGTELELRNPHGVLSNKIGTATFHEHNDKHFHLEGVVVRKSEDASLEKFMRVTKGYLQPDAIGVPLNEAEPEWYVKDDQLDGDQQSQAAVEQLKTYVKDSPEGPVMDLVTGKKCGDDRAELQVFVYKFDKTNNTYHQEKLADPTKYVMSEEPSLGPPSDCIVVEFDKPKDRTDKLCEQYGVKDAKRCTEFGVKQYDPGQCYIKEVQDTTQEEPDSSTEESNDTQDKSELQKKCQQEAQDPVAGISAECAKLLQGDY